MFISSFKKSITVNNNKLCRPDYDENGINSKKNHCAKRRLYAATEQNMTITIARPTTVSTTLIVKKITNLNSDIN